VRPSTPISFTPGSSSNDTHNPALRSWVESANAEGSDFPIQNLPFGRFRQSGQPGDSAWRIAVAIGDQVLDLRAAGLIDHVDMNRLMQATPAERRALRQAISAGLREDSAQRAAFEPALLAQAAVELGLPCEVGDYTDFYVGIHHATEVGRQFRPDIGYHGRSSTLLPSGASFHRPMGQVKAADAAQPVLAPCARLDIELELGLFIGQPNPQGQPVPIGEAEQHLFGVTLFNDWSARDLQAWEYQPLGPFLAKNFASTVSPWMVTMEALEPFRQPFARPAGDPDPLPYLDSPDNRARGAMAVHMEVVLQTARMAREGHAGDVIAHSNFAEAAYWTAAQLVAHHTVNGCALRAGDLFGSGTLSGATKDQCGSLLELTTGGKNPVTLSNGEQRGFLEDGDTVILRGWCEREGARRIGFGECRGTVLPVFTRGAS
jgi:fumarylacetoacetase